MECCLNDFVSGCGPIKRVHTMIRHVIIISLIAVGVSHNALAKKAGQSTKVQYGVVTASKEVDLSSNAVPKGALVGGTIGLLSTRRGPSRQNRTRNVIVGTAAGAAIGGASSSGNTGILYDVSVGNGVVQVVTDQTEIRVDDCVAVEQAGETTNLRRVSADFCDQANAAAISATADEASEEAEECLAAKQELVRAETKEQADLAAMKIKLLCND